jgi:hypothetical protein
MRGSDWYDNQNSDGKEIPVRWIAEEHIRQDCGFIPTVKDWCSNIELQKWMGRVVMKSEELELA